MSLLQTLGLGGVFGSTPPDYWQENLQEQLQQQYYSPFSPICHHGINCLICLENAKKVVETLAKQEALKIQKKLDYENRCKVYMKKFHKYCLVKK